MQGIFRWLYPRCPGCGRVFSVTPGDETCAEVLEVLKTVPMLPGPTRAARGTSSEVLPPRARVD
jgi:hypothetical protein